MVLKRWQLTLDHSKVSSLAYFNVLLQPENLLMDTTGYIKLVSTVMYNISLYTLDL